MKCGNCEEQPPSINHQLTNNRPLPIKTNRFNNEGYLNKTLNKLYQYVSYSWKKERVKSYHNSLQTCFWYVTSQNVDMHIPLNSLTQSQPT